MSTQMVQPVKGMRRYAFAPFIAVSLLHLAFIVFENEALVAISKPLLMPALLFGLLIAAPSLKSGLVWITATAVAFSWLGDVLLQTPSDMGFVLGLAAFLVAQLLYITAYVRVGRGRLSPWLLVYLVWYVGFLVLILPSLGSLTVPVIIYGAVLGSAGILATRVNWFTGLGSALFVASDSILASDRFLAGLEIPFVDFLIMATYLAAEALIVFGLLRVLRENRG